MTTDKTPGHRAAYFPIEIRLTATPTHKATHRRDPRSQKVPTLASSILALFDELVTASVEAAKVMDAERARAAERFETDALGRMSVAKPHRPMQGWRKLAVGGGDNAR